VVTGGAGFIGSSLVRALVRRGYLVRVVDDFSSGRRENLADLGTTVGLDGTGPIQGGVGSVEIVEGTILDDACLDQAFSHADVVFHHAAIPSVSRSIANPVASHEVNATGTLTVLEAARRAGVRRIVYAASSSAYGETPTLPKVETMACAPLSPYAVAKLAGEHYCQVYARVFGLETVILRYFNVFGPRQDPASPYAAVLPLFITAALEKRPPTIYGDGSQSRDFCFVDNVVAANVLAADAKDVSGQIFNVACGARTSLGDVVRLLGEIVGWQIEPRYQPSRAGDIKHSLADISKARTMLGYTNPIPFAVGLERTITWYREKSRHA